MATKLEQIKAVIQKENEEFARQRGSLSLAEFKVLAERFAFAARITGIIDAPDVDTAVIQQ